MHVLLLITQYLHVPILVDIMIVYYFICSSEEWNKVPKKERDKLGLKVEDDGEFWLVHVHSRGSGQASLPKTILIISMVFCCAIVAAQKVLL